MKLRLTAKALEGIEAIVDFIHRNHPAGARRVGQPIQDSIRNLLSFPHMGRRQTIPFVRKLSTPKYPYIIYYTWDEPQKELVILNIKHAALQRLYEDR